MYFQTWILLNLEIIEYKDCFCCSISIIVAIASPSKNLSLFLPCWTFRNHTFVQDFNKPNATFSELSGNNSSKYKKSLLHIKKQSTTPRMYNEYIEDCSDVPPLIWFVGFKNKPFIFWTVNFDLWMWTNLSLNIYLERHWFILFSSRFAFTKYYMVLSLTFRKWASVWTKEKVHWVSRGKRIWNIYFLLIRINLEMLFQCFLLV